MTLPPSRFGGEKVPLNGENQEDRRCRGPVPLMAERRIDREGFVKDYPKEAFVSTIIAVWLGKEFSWDDSGHWKIEAGTPCFCGSHHVLRTHI